MKQCKCTCNCLTPPPRWTKKAFFGIWSPVLYFVHAVQYIANRSCQSYTSNFVSRLLLLSYPWYVLSQKKDNKTILYRNNPVYICSKFQEQMEMYGYKNTPSFSSTHTDALPTILLSEYISVQYYVLYCTYQASAFADAVFYLGTCCRQRTNKNII